MAFNVGGERINKYPNSVLLYLSYFPRVYIQSINNIKEPKSSDREYKEGAAGGSGQKKDPPKEYDEKEQPRGNHASFTLHSYKL